MHYGFPNESPNDSPAYNQKVPSAPSSNKRKRRSCTCMEAQRLNFDANKGF